MGGIESCGNECGRGMWDAVGIMQAKLKCRYLEQGWTGPGLR